MKMVVLTVGLDGNEHTTSSLQKERGVVADDTGLVGLRNVGENDVYHWEQHSVLQGMSGIFNDGDDLRD